MSSAAGKPPALRPAQHQTSANSSRNGDINLNGSLSVPRSAGKSKRTLIENACAACRRRKSRCDGHRPACSRCQTLQTSCEYEAEEGESRWSALRRRNKILETERAEMHELLTYLQSRPEVEAREIFNRIRSCGPEDVFNLLREIREQGIAPSPTAPPDCEHRLPSINSLFEVSGASVCAPQPALWPPSLPLSYSSGSMSEQSRGSQDYGRCSTSSRGSASGP
ncbi:hypothetical protein NU195Hw_Modified_258t2 [Hortaea werneckii]